MKKYFNKLLFLSIISLFILIPTKTKAAADDIVMYMECSYSVTYGMENFHDYSLSNHQNGNFKVFYTELNDSKGNPFSVYTNYIYDYITLNKGINDDLKLTKSNIKDSTSTKTSFASSYASMNKCPKYMMVEEIGSDYIVQFYNTKDGACKDESSGKCRLVYENSDASNAPTVIRKVSPKEDSWIYKVVNTDADICTDLNIEYNVSSAKQLTAMALYGPSSKYTGYTNWTSPKIIDKVDFKEIATLATSNSIPRAYFDPDDKEFLSNDTTGFYFATELEFALIDITGSPTCYFDNYVYSPKKKCTVYSEVEASINSYNTAFYTKYNALKAEADKYLTKNNITYIIKDGISDSVIGSSAVAAKINSAITAFESLDKSQSGATVDYLKSLIDGGTLCSEEEEKVANLLNELSSQISDGKQIIIGLKNVLEKMKANFIASGDKENANIVDGYINNANSAIDKLNVISRKARESYLASTNFNIVGQIGGSTCNIISTDLREFLQTIVDYVRIIGIVLAIILGILDYIKVIFGSDEKSMSKANKNMMTRIIAVALLFLIPAILNFALGLFDVYGSDTGTCGVE